MNPVCSIPSEIVPFPLKNDDDDEQEHFTMMESTVSPTSSLDLLSSDLDNARLERKREEGAAEQALEAVGSLLATADTALSDLETNHQLGTAIVRGCTDLANAIGGLASELEQQTDQERRALAEACMQDVVANQELLLMTNEVETETTEQQERPGAIQETSLSNVSQDDMMMALAGATTLLRDVEASFRSIDESEAEEIADLALTLARLFLMSIQDFYHTITPQDLVEMANQDQQKGLSSSRGIEILDEEYLELANDEASATTAPPQRKKKRPTKRVRVLWPPLGPAVTDACQWSKEEAAKKPLLAVALGLCLWPVAIPTFLIATPTLLVDNFLQNTYDSFSEHSLVENLERGAAELVTAGKLCFVSGRLVTRQTLRVASRQIERRGGVERVAQDLGEMALDRAMHPIETIGMAWNGVTFGLGALRDAVVQVQKMTSSGGAGLDETHETNLYY